jgi:histidine triad (HIT) family protein
VQKIGHAIKEGLGISAFNLMQNDGPVAGQVIPHLHFHIIPRYEGDGLKHWPHKSYSSEEEALAVAEKIRREL